MTVYQYLVRDNQETSFDSFLITPRHYSSLKAALWDWESKGATHVVVCPFELSAVDDPTIVGSLTRHERQR